MDNISSLPDEVLCHILSFFTTKEAASTSVLSKRWRNQFASSPNLDIDDSEFLYPEEGKQEREGVIESFMDFLDRVLALQGDSPIKKVSLKCTTGVDPSRVNHWICNVLQRGVSDLDLYIGFPTYEGSEVVYYLPQKMSVSRTLVNLKLRSEFGVGWWTEGEGISLPMLKSLVLDSVELYYDQFQTLLRGCPVLERLNLVNVECEDWPDTPVLSSASLKVLRISSESCFGSFSFDTPNLFFVDYSQFVAGDYPVVNLENVVDARINLLVTNDQIKRAREPNNDLLEDDEEDVVLRFGNVKKLMSGVRNAKNLYLSPTTLEVLSLCSEAMPVFKNLRFLAILSHVDLGWQAMPVLLKNCPHLETLALWGLLHCVTENCGDACCCNSREDKGRSLKTCPVKTLRINGFRGTNKELKMIKHFLYSFPCLKVMDIHAEEKGPTDFEIPGKFENVMEMMTLYNELFSCDVQFMVCDSLYTKWSTAQ